MNLFAPIIRIKCFFSWVMVDTDADAVSQAVNYCSDNELTTLQSQSHFIGSHFIGYRLYEDELYETFMKWVTDQTI